MKLFLDTAIVEEIRTINAWGVLDGITTNPSLVYKSGRPFKEVLKEICAIVDGPVSAEVTTLTAPEMVKQGFELSKIHKNIVVKLPTNEEGLKACKALSGKGIPVNMTLIFSPSQALLVAKAGAAMASPFIGRLDDISQDGMQLIRDIRTIYDNYGFKTEILTASIRHPMHVVDAAIAGSDIATLPFKVFQQLIRHPLTDAGLKAFMEDWAKAKH